MSSPVIAAKAENGDVVFAGCIVGPRQHWTVCSTCGLRFDDQYIAWEDSYPRDLFAPESKMNPSCTSDTIRRVLSKELQLITFEVIGAKPFLLSCSRWYGSSGIVGESVCVSTKMKGTDVLTKLEVWLRDMGAPAKANLDPADAKDRTWKWAVGGKSFVVNLNATSEDTSYISLEWHKENIATVPFSGDKSQK
jgi:hypothetical protein